MREKKLRHLVEPDKGIYSGYSFRGRGEHDPEGDLYAIQMRDIDDESGRVNKEELKKLSSHDIRYDHYLINNDILVISRGYNFKAILYRADLTLAIATSAFFIIRCDPKKLDPAYLAWHMNQPANHYPLVSQGGSTSGMYVIKKKQLEEYELPVPPLAVQRNISQLVTLSARAKELQLALATKRETLTNAYINQAINI